MLLIVCVASLVVWREVKLIRVFIYQNSIPSYFTILKNYFINYTILFYNTPNIPKLYFFFPFYLNILFYSFFFFLWLFLFFSSFSSLSPLTSSTSHNNTNPNPHHQSTHRASNQTQKPTNLHQETHQFPRFKPISHNRSKSTPPPDPWYTDPFIQTHHLTHDPSEQTALITIRTNHIHIGANPLKPYWTHRSKQHTSPSEQTIPTLEQTHSSKTLKPHRSKTSRHGLGLALLGDGGQRWPEGEITERE